MKSYEEYLIKNIKKSLQKRLEFAMLLSLVKSKDINNTKELDKYINEEIQICRNWLANNKTGSTINRIRRDYTKKLENFELMKRLIKDLK